jgi:hypothetical protein
MKRKNYGLKIVLIVFGILCAVLLAWFLIKIIFPLHPKNELQISEREILIDSYELPKAYYASHYTTFLPLQNGKYIYTLTTDYYVNMFAQNEEKADESRIYLLSETFETIDTIEFTGYILAMFALDNGNFTVCMERDNHTFFREYNTDLELINERELPDDIRFSSHYGFYSDGYYYAGFGDDIKILDEDLNIIQTFTKDDFLGCLVISFVQSFDGTPYVLVQYNNVPDNYNMPENYTLRSVDGGTDVSFSLGDSIMASLFGLRQGDRNFSFYTESGNLNLIPMYIFLENIQGDYIYGIRADGSFERIKLVDENSSIDRNYYNGYLHNNKRYYPDAFEENNTLKINLYEYTATYPE